jgi:hypothetical protein
MGGLSGEIGTSGSGTGTQALGRLRFWTCVGYPGADVRNRQAIFETSAHPITVSPLLLGHVVRGELDQASALASYDAALQRRWPQLRDWLARGGEHVLWIPTEMAATINPLPLLIEILSKCGAEYLGNWNERQQQGVA